MQEEIRNVIIGCGWLVGYISESLTSYIVRLFFPMEWIRSVMYVIRRGRCVLSIISYLANKSQGYTEHRDDLGCTGFHVITTINSDFVNVYNICNIKKI